MIFVVREKRPATTGRGLTERRYSHLRTSTRQLIQKKKNITENTLQPRIEHDSIFRIRTEPFGIDGPKTPGGLKPLTSYPRPTVNRRTQPQG